MAMKDISEVLRAFTAERLVELWRSTWGAGGPHNKGPINMTQLEELARGLRATPPGTDPSVPAGRALHAITYGRPFWDCNKRTGWTVCFAIMSAMDYALVAKDEAVERVVLAVENGQLTAEETAAAVAKLFRAYRAKSR